MKNKNPRKIPARYAKTRKIFWAIASCAILSVLCIVPAAAAGPVETLTNFTDILFSLVRIVGVIACLWGIVNFAIALKSHDASQRTQGIVAFAVGLLIVFAREILQAIGVSV